MKIDAITLIFVVAGLGFTATAFMALWRVIVGPTILDRMVASDVLVTTVMLVVGADMVVRRHTDSMILMLILAATSVFGTILVAQYVRRRRDLTPDGSSEPVV